MYPRFTGTWLSEPWCRYTAHASGKDIERFCADAMQSCEKVQRGFLVLRDEKVSLNGENGIWNLVHHWYRAIARLLFSIRSLR